MAVSASGIAAVAPALPAIGAAYGRAPAEVGWVIAAYALPRLVAGPWIGAAADRWGRRRVLVWALVLFAAAGAGCALAPGFGVLVALRFAQGVGGAALRPVNLAVLSDAFRGGRRRAVFGYNGAVAGVAATAAPLCGGALALADWRWPFLLALLALPAAAGVARLDLPAPVLAAPERIAWRVLAAPGVAVLVLAGVATYTLLYGAVVTFLPAHAREAWGTAALGAGALLALMAAADTGASLGFGALSRRVRARTLLPLSFAAYAGALAAMAWAPSPWALAPAAVLFGVGTGVGMLAATTELVRIVPGHARAFVLAVAVAGLSLGQSAGPLLGGWAAAALGTRALFTAASVVALACCAAFAWRPSRP